MRGDRREGLLGGNRFGGNGRAGTAGKPMYGCVHSAEELDVCLDGFELNAWRRAREGHYGGGEREERGVENQAGEYLS